MAQGQHFPFEPRERAFALPGQADSAGKDGSAPAVDDFTVGGGDLRGVRLRR